MTTFASFVPLASNQAALNATLRWATGIRGSGNPLVLVGPSGVGKTHLVRAALALAYPMEDAHVLVAADWAFELSAAIAGQRMSAFRARVRGWRAAVVVENLEDLEGKSETCRELFGLLARVARRGRGDRPSHARAVRSTCNYASTRQPVQRQAR